MKSQAIFTFAPCSDVMSPAKKEKKMAAMFDKPAVK